MLLSGCEEYMRDKFGNLVYDVTVLDKGDCSAFPEAEKVKGKRLEVIQGPGQVIFVPSGWHHQVFNLVGGAIY